MKFSKLTAIAIATIFINAASVSTAASQDACGCSAALDASLLDIFEYRMGSQGAFTSEASMCNEAKSIYEQSEKSGGSVGIGTFSLNADRDRSRTSNDFRKVCSDEFKNSDNNLKTEIIRRNINPTLATAFQQCMKSCNNDEFGFEVTRQEQFLSINIFNKKGNNLINRVQMKVDDIEVIDSKDGGNFVNCRLQIGQYNIEVPRSVIDGQPKELHEGISLSENSGALVCERKIVRANNNGNQVSIYPGYSVHIGIGDRIIDQYIPRKSTGHLSSPEYDSLMKTVEGVVEVLNLEVQNHKTQIEKLNEKISKIHSRKWHDVRAKRVLGTEYHNDKDYSLEISVSANPHGATGVAGNDRNRCAVRLIIDDSPIAYHIDNSPHFYRNCVVYGTIPAGSRYKVIAPAWNPNSTVRSRIATDNKQSVNWFELY